MKKSFKKWIAPAAFGLFGLGLVPSAMADNPFIQTYYSPDPAPVVFGDTLCSYSGNDEGGSFFTMHGWRVSCTTDMVNWTDMGELILESQDFGGSAKKNGDWAAQVIRRKDASGKYKYYYYVTVESTKGGRAVNVAVADTKEGPFKDALNGQHLAGPNWNYIDPTVWIDDDGQAYLYWGNPILYWAKLKEDMITLDGGVHETDMTEDGFGKKHCDSNGECTKSGYTEGPWIHKRGKKYYMIYAGKGVPESIDYSWSDSPTGPWKYVGTIMPSGESGSAFTIHSGIVDFKGRSFFFYHNQRRVPGAGGYSRTSAVEEFTWGADGTIPTIHMTDDGVTKPIKNLDPYTRVEAETKAWVEGINLDKSGGYTIIKNIETEGKTVYLTNMNAGSWTKVRSVDMSDGADNIVVCTKGGSGVVELHSGSEKGPLLSTINVPASDSWKESSFEVTGADGVADLYFVFKSGNFKFDYWYFESSAQAVPQEPFYGTAFAIPGKIQAEDFDKPGVGRGNKAFYDSDDENHGESEYRKEDAPSVDIYDKTTRRIVGYITNGEWLEYSIDVAKDGDYTMYAAVASDGGSKFKLSVDGVDVTEDIAVPASRKSEDDEQNFDSYSKVSAKVKLTKGKHILRFTATADWLDVDYFNFEEGANAEDSSPVGSAADGEMTAEPSSSASIPGSSASEDGSTPVAVSSASNASAGDGTTALNAVNFATVAESTFDVFGLTGKYLGRLNVASGERIAERLVNAGFSKGVYMVRGLKNGRVQRVNAAK